MFSMTNRDELLSTISDMYKDAFGIRPHGMFNDYSEVELRAEIERLQPLVDEVVEAEKQADAMSITRFNDEVATFIREGAANRSTAIRWVLEAHYLTSETPDFICYNFEINPYIPQGREIFEEVEAAIATL